VEAIEKNVEDGAYQVAQNQSGDAVDFEKEGDKPGCGC
jgi:hypothetical protein